MRTELISFDMQENIEKIRLKYGVIASPFSFSSLYIWRSIIGDKIHIGNELYSLKCKNANTWIFPCGSNDEKIEFIRQLLSEAADDKSALEFVYVRDEDKEFLEQNFNGLFTITASPDMDEYIYLADEQRNIKGNKFHRIRNRINKLKIEHSVRTEILDESHLEEALKVIESWASDKDIVGNISTRGDEADEGALNEMKKLGINGVVVFVDGKVAALAAGYYLSEEVYDIFMCKVAKRIPGIVYFTRRELIFSLDEKCLEVDLEDDCGLEGLRNMKEELRPVRKIKMWKAVLNEF